MQDNLHDKAKYILYILYIFIFLSLLNIYVSNDKYNMFMNNDNLYLECYIQYEYVEVNKSKIISFDDTTNYWTFTNGYAKNCKIHKRITNDN